MSKQENFLQKGDIFFSKQEIFLSEVMNIFSKQDIFLPKGDIFSKIDFIFYKMLILYCNRVFIYLFFGEFPFCAKDLVFLENN